MGVNNSIHFTGLLDTFNSMCLVVISMVEMVLALVALSIKIVLFLFLLLLLIFNGGTMKRT